MAAAKNTKAQSGPDPMARKYPESTEDRASEASTTSVEATTDGETPRTTQQTTANPTARSNRTSEDEEHATSKRSSDTERLESTKKAKMAASSSDRAVRHFRKYAQQLEQQEQQQQLENANAKADKKPTANSLDDEDNDYDDDDDDEHMPHVAIIHKTGSLFDCPHGSVLTHACNARGSWGAGVAAAFKKQYPRAFAAYASHCAGAGAGRNPAALVGTALLIEPQREGKGRERADWVACLFTRERPGFPRGLGKAATERAVQETLAATRAAWMDLIGQIEGVRRSGGAVGGVCMPRINAGLFRCPWERTEEVLAATGRVDAEAVRAIGEVVVVYTPDE